MAGNVMKKPPVFAILLSIAAATGCIAFALEPYLAPVLVGLGLPYDWAVLIIMAVVAAVLVIWLRRNP